MSRIDEPGVEAPTLFLVTGVPGTGKSAVAEVVAGLAQASVLSHDWAMSALRPYPEVQRVLDTMEPSGHRTVGWSIVCALAREQLRGGRSVVLDGVARSPEVTMVSDTAHEESARFVLLATWCSDPDVHRSRIESRRRLIPDWYELGWENVERTLTGWEPLIGTDLCLDATEPWEDNVDRIRSLLGARR
jgi:predicted kinase